MIRAVNVIPRALRLLRTAQSKGFRAACAAVGRRIPPWEVRLRDRYYEWRLGIATAGEIPAPALGHPHADYHHYGPSYYDSIHRILRIVDVQAGRDVFIDFGSGKGRVLVVAAAYPFRRIIGIERSEALCEIARHNIEVARTRFACRDIEIVATDATTYAVPDAVTVLYFANPFSGAVLDAVLKRIEASLIRTPRRIRLISHSHDPAYPFEQQIRRCPWLELSGTVKLQRGTRAWIYTNV